MKAIQTTCLLLNQAQLNSTASARFMLTPDEWLRYTPYVVSRKYVDMNRTTVRLPESLMVLVKSEATRTGKTITALIEEGLRLVLAKTQKPLSERPRYTFHRNTDSALPQSGVNMNNSANLADALERQR